MAGGVECFIYLIWGNRNGLVFDNVRDEDVRVGDEKKQRTSDGLGGHGCRAPTRVDAERRVVVRSETSKKIAGNGQRQFMGPSAAATKLQDCTIYGAVCLFLWVCLLRTYEDAVI
ncbi:hypothetical protein L6452_43208 [Arctium lappa]|uniref:Uncharacterized protein n=1 Tax=Arctium lappa TaxID=4217 RepID=A0ACB8XPH3_ARCLA|nr:hypothetical protein L6452_43208 [Arctium lappa]